MKKEIQGRGASVSLIGGQSARSGTGGKFQRNAAFSIQTFAPKYFSSHIFISPS